MIKVFFVTAALLGANTAFAACNPGDWKDPVAGAQQGSMITGRAPIGSSIDVNGKALKQGKNGDYVFGIARDATGVAKVTIKPSCGDARVVSVNVLKRDFPVERVNGVPPKTANPTGAIAQRIEAEQARVTAARQRNDDRQDYLQKFIWPVTGRISGRFGSSRSYNGQPGAAHSGMDIAVGTGTPVKAPAGGVVTFADPGLYLTGGTLVLDHGQGISSNFLHLSRIDVKVGDVVRQGDVVARVGATGRATGPHLHWGMNWLDTRIDPLLLLEKP